ncbi:MAG: glutaredoxin family protein [Leptolyngbyaceae bacterium]|nr:glutaredoxin family protein [Leptolyngbyaceae bacterium]
MEQYGDRARLPHKTPFRISPMKLILYSKPGCHLCEGLQEKLQQVQSLEIDLEIRDITTDPAWLQAYEYEIPVLYWVRGGELFLLPRLSPRATVAQVEQLLQKYIAMS